VDQETIHQLGPAAERGEFQIDAGERNQGGRLHEAGRALVVILLFEDLEVVLHYFRSQLFVWDAVQNY
jgi:hypothetical protein